MKTVGIDLSADPTKTAVCELDWSAGTVRLLSRPVPDEAIVDAVVAADLAGIDVPLGWPDGFVAAVVAHHDGVGWPPVAVEVPEDRVPLRFRRTDLAVMSAGPQPLSVSTDRIGVAAMRGARIQALLADAGVLVDRSGVQGRVAEVYPAAALRAWGLVHRGYKGTKNRAACRDLAAALAESCGRLANAVAEALVDADDDDVDAVVCALVAGAVRARQTTGPPPDAIAAAQREGWIHVPVAPLKQITES
jgi:predicted nuclease with RNAse H fold